MRWLRVLEETLFMAERTLSTSSGELSGPVRKCRTAERGGAIISNGRKGSKATPGLAGLAQKPPAMITALTCRGNLSASLRAREVENDSAMMTVLALSSAFF